MRGAVQAVEDAEGAEEEGACADGPVLFLFFSISTYLAT